MIIQDRVYGRIEITEPAAVELILSPVMQRLKHVDQGGYTTPFYATKYHDRFEHSVGVYWLLKSYGAPLEEQIAGLIHDVSHSVFSHAIDYVKSDGHRQDHQDRVHNNFVRQSEIPAILSRHGLSAEIILDEEKFPLKEAPLPQLCADRIDYVLRAPLTYIDDRYDVDDILSHLATAGGQWVFTSPDSAQHFADLFLDMNTRYFASIIAAAMGYSVGQTLKFALQEKYLEESDLYLTDDEVIAKLAPYAKKDARLARWWERMHNRASYTHDPSLYEAEVWCKSRIVDPLVKQGKSLKPLSAINPAWQDTVRQHMQPKRYCLRYI